MTEGELYKRKVTVSQIEFFAEDNDTFVHTMNLDEFKKEFAELDKIHYTDKKIHEMKKCFQKWFGVCFSPKETKQC